MTDPVKDLLKEIKNNEVQKKPFRQQPELPKPETLGQLVWQLESIIERSEEEMKTVMKSPKQKLLDVKVPRPPTSKRVLLDVEKKTKKQKKQGAK